MTDHLRTPWLLGVTLLVFAINVVVAVWDLAQRNYPLAGFQTVPMLVAVGLTWLIVAGHERLMRESEVHRATLALLDEQQKTAALINRQIRDAVTTVPVSRSQQSH